MANFLNLTFQISKMRLYTLAKQSYLWCEVQICRRWAKRGTETNILSNPFKVHQPASTESNMTYIISSLLILSYNVDRSYRLIGTFAMIKRISILKYILTSMMLLQHLVHKFHFWENTLLFAAQLQQWGVQGNFFNLLTFRYKIALSELSSLKCK